MGEDDVGGRYPNPWRSCETYCRLMMVASLLCRDRGERSRFEQDQRLDFRLDVRQPSMQGQVQRA